MMGKEMKRHKLVIEEFLKEINAVTKDYILKGGTSLMECYNLDRFSEDIDFDSTNYETIGRVVEKFCDKHSYTYRIAKDTETVQRYMIHYGSAKPLKIETSFRKKTINVENVTEVKGISVYTINEIATQKVNAYNSRDKLRDLYDVTFICNNYWNVLDDKTKDAIQNAVEYKGLEHFDYIVKTQDDPLIDNNKLADDFLTMYDKLGLLSDYELSRDYNKIPSIEDPEFDNQEEPIIAQCAIEREHGL